MNDQPFVIKLLGTPVMSWQGTAVLLPRRQARALLYRLAIGMQPVSRDTLLFLLWPDTPESRARRNLTRLLSFLRQDLPDPTLLQTTRSTVTLNTDLAWSDVVAFEQLNQSDDMTQWETAVALYRGSFLSGFSLSISLEFDAWQSQQQYVYERRYLAALNKLVVAKRQVGQLPSAIDYAQSYLAVDDLSEEIQRLLIELFAQTGERSAALRQFEQCVLVLERELGVSPLPETRAAYEAILDNQERSAPQKTIEPEWETLPSLDLPLTGREAAWQTLTKAYGRFHNGGVIFIAGEPGVGKSRLMQEFATARTELVLSGNNHVGSTSIPYQPLIQALRQALTLHSRWTHALPIWLAELSRLLPELSAHFTNMPQTVDVEPQQAQPRLFEAFLQLFISLATDSPLLLCLDDIHWADESTHSWLQYVTRRLVGSNICILATYRTHERAVLQEWQQVLQRSNLMTVVSLDGLTATAVADILDQVQSGSQNLQTLATRIHAATGGNTFFVLETIRELIETGQIDASPATLPLPTTVREAVLGRVEHLGSLTRQILEITAVLSPTATFASIRAAAGRDDMETANSLEELTMRQLLRPDNNQFDFHHALAREAIYQSISPWRQRLLHQRAAKALITLPQEEKIDLAEIAAHFEAAGELKQAIDYYRQAAIDAAAIFAHQEAIQQLHRAIALVLHDEEETGILPALYESLADNLTIVGKFSEAEKTYYLALEIIPSNEPLRLAEIQLKIAATLPPQQREGEAENIYRTALVYLDKSPPITVVHQWQSTQLDILLGLLDTLYFQQRLQAMVDLKAQTNPLLAAVGTAAQKANYTFQLNQIAWLQNRFRIQPELISLAQKTLQYAQESGNALLIASQQFHVGFQLLWYGDLENAEQAMLQAVRAAKELGDSWLYTRCLVYLTVLYRFRSNSDRVLEYQSQLLKVAQEIDNKLYIGVTQANAAWLFYNAREWGQAQKQAEKAHANWADTPYPFQWLVNWLLLALAVRANHLPAATKSAQEMLDPKQQKLPDDLNDMLTTAVTVWQAGDEEKARDYLNTAVKLASQYGYL